MKIINQLRPFSWKEQVTRYLILKLYQYSGESTFTITNSEKIISRLVKSQYRLESILPHYLHVLDNSERAREHRIIRFVANSNFRISAHIIPSEFEIPTHLHPSKMSFTYLLKGKLEIKQLSLTSSDAPYYCQLNDNKMCAGLIKLRNIHRIRSMHQPCVFLSIRITAPQKILANKKVRYFTRSVLASTLLYILPIFTLLHSASANDRNQINTATTVQNAVTHNQLLLANQLRKRQDFYEAVQLYKKVSKQGNAEAQYWLGVMYFDGSGITDDRDEAMHWIGLSSDQNYPPAQKLLQYLLNTEEVLDC